MSASNQTAYLLFKKKIFFFVVLGLILRAFELSYIPSPILFSVLRQGFSKSPVPLRELGLQVCASMSG